MQCKCRRETSWCFEDAGEIDRFTDTLGEAIPHPSRPHEPSLAGRSAAVLHAKSPEWEGTNLVVNIGWPGSERVAENEFPKKVTSKAKSTVKNK